MTDEELSNFLVGVHVLGMAGEGLDDLGLWNIELMIMRKEPLEEEHIATVMAFGKRISDKGSIDKLIKLRELLCNAKELGFSLQ